MLDTVHGGGAGRCGLHGVIPFVSWLEFEVRDGKPFSRPPLSSAAGCATACARSGCRGIQLRGCPPACGLPLDAAAPNAPPAWSGPPSLGALLLVQDQVAVAFSSAAVPRPAASSLMPLRGTPRRPDPAWLRLRRCIPTSVVILALGRLPHQAWRRSGSRQTNQLPVGYLGPGLSWGWRWLLPGLPRFGQAAKCKGGGGWGN